MKNLYRFYWDCGRSGHIEGLFSATEDEIKNALGKKLAFYEVLGKHSEIDGVLEEVDLTKIDLDQESVARISSQLGDTWCGHNPLFYIQDSDPFYLEEKK